MSLMCEIEKLMNATESSNEYRVINLGGKSLYVEGIKSVVSIGGNELIFQMKKCVISIFGKDFKIKYLDKTTCVVLGEILEVKQQ